MKHLTDLVGMGIAGFLLMIPTIVFVSCVFVIAEGLLWSMRFFTQ